MNLVLIGYRGTGKSTIGRIVAEKLSMQLVSTDEEIVRRAGKSIPEIVEEHSWEYFRDLEEDVVRDLSGAERMVIDSGGGVIVRQINVNRLRATGLVFLLETRVEDIVKRISGDSERPSLTADKSFTEEVAEVLKQRQSLYEAAAHFRINTSTNSERDAADQISRIFRENTP